MKVLITGSGGLVGSTLMKSLKDHEVIGLSKKELDVTVYHDCYQTIVKRLKPDILIHCAAYTSVDKAEADHVKCNNVNAYGTENIALCCKYLGIPMVYLSTDAVFDGKTTVPYKEDSAPNPQSEYGKSKYQGELAIRKYLHKYFIIRTIWIYGKGRPNLVTDAAAKFLEGNAVFPIINQEATPTNVDDLADMIGKLILTDKWGVYHYTNSGSASRIQVIQYIAQLMDKKSFTISKYKAKAPRPEYCIFDLTKTEELLGAIPHWKESLKRFIEGGLTRPEDIHE